MSASTGPYPLPRSVPADFVPILSYWKGLRRGEAQMPFGDDLDLSVFKDGADNMVLLDVFDHPKRFRLSIVGGGLRDQPNGAVAGKFLDEIEIPSSFQFFASQASATIESASPSYFRYEGVGPARSYSRLLLPMWGDGRIASLLAAFAFD